MHGYEQSSPNPYDRTNQRGCKKARSLNSQKAVLLGRQTLNGKYDVSRSYFRLGGWLRPGPINPKNRRIQASNRDLQMTEKWPGRVICRASCGQRGEMLCPKSVRETAHLADKT